MRWVIADRETSQRALVYIYEKHRHQLWLTAYDIVGDEIYAQDIVQDIFYRLWETGLIEGTKKQQLAYVRKAVKNLAKDVAAALEREKKGVLTLTQQVKEPENLENLVLTKERIDEIYQAATTLSQKERLVFCYHVLEGLSYDEISAKWSINKKNAYVLMYRIRKKLKKVWLSVLVWVC